MALAAVTAMQPMVTGVRPALSRRHPLAAGVRPAHPRRHLLAAGSALLLSPLVPAKTWAAEPLADIVEPQLAYRLRVPSDWKEAPKPVKTHLHEALLASPDGRGVKIGITVDPVKIDSLEAFGTLQQVTDRVLAVEAGRDGVNRVDLRATAAQGADVESGTPSYYTIEYATDSSRGKKVFCCKYCITARKLYVLQAQAKQDAFDGDEAVRSQLRAVVESFTVGA